MIERRDAASSKHSDARNAESFGRHFWVSAAAVRLGLAPLALVHAAPILMNIALVLLCVLLLLRTGRSRLFTAVAVFVFGTTFRYEWLVLRGGLSRGFGSLFLLASLLMPMKGKPRTVVAAVAASVWHWQERFDTLRSPRERHGARNSSQR